MGFRHLAATQNLCDNIAFVAKILIIDDEADVRAAVEEWVASMGHTFETAADIPSGMDAFHKDIFDLIISDYNLPLLSGLDLLSYLNDKRINVPVIWISGFADRETFREGWRTGLFEFLEKPFTFDQLKDAVDKAIAFGKQSIA